MAAVILNKPQGQRLSNNVANIGESWTAVVYQSNAVQGGCHKNWQPNIVNGGKKENCITNAGSSQFCMDLHVSQVR